MSSAETKDFDHVRAAASHVRTRGKFELVAALQQKAPVCLASLSAAVNIEDDETEIPVVREFGAVMTVLARPQCIFRFSLSNHTSNTAFKSDMRTSSLLCPPVSSSSPLVSCERWL